MKQITCEYCGSRLASPDSECAVCGPEAARRFHQSQAQIDIVINLPSWRKWYKAHQEAKRHVQTQS